MFRCIPIALLFLTLNAAALPRDRNQVNAFKRHNPCPVTGQTKGRCPGHEVDHVNALRCGGADKPDNMQWITIAAHKVKTRKEHRECRRSVKGR